MDKDLFFTTHYDEFKLLVNKRRAKWRATSIMEWADVESILLTRIYQQLHHYDESKPLDRWVNTLISNAIMSLLRDNIFKTARPCIAANSYGAQCTFNLGGDKCSWTKSGRQCGECKFFAAWEKKKQGKFAISTPLSIENHVDENYSRQDNFFDIEEGKKIVDENIKRRLTKEEYRIYVLLCIKYLDIDEAAKKMGFVKINDNDMRGYMIVRNASIKIKETIRAIISEKGLNR